MRPERGTTTPDELERITEASFPGWYLEDPAAALAAVVAVIECRPTVYRLAASEIQKIRIAAGIEENS
jgi:hypothetical protein